MSNEPTPEVDTDKREQERAIERIDRLMEMMRNRTRFGKVMNDGEKQP